jgi:hypothetical protein
MKPRHKILALVLICLFLQVNPARSVQQIYTPDILKPWQNWVLHNNKQNFCPNDYNDDQKRHCSWISYLDLDLNMRKSQFFMKGILYREQYVLLPGQNGYWPEDVIQRNKVLPVVPYTKHPAILLPEGPFEITGRFLYDRLPESLYIPPQVGLLTLKLEGKAIHHPFFAKENRLWLRTGQSKSSLGNRMHIRIYRLLTDSIPMTMTHHLQLSISGNSREELLNNILPDNAIVLSIDSPLPIQLEENTNLRMHVRTGKWTIQIVSRFIMPVHHLKPDFLMQDSEIWSFKSQTYLRMVKLIGLQGLDPASSGVPQEWQNFPAYRVNKHTPLTFHEQQRGEPDPTPDQLSLNRDLWLDFDGDGYTIHDQIKGLINQNWRLNMYQPIQLGRVSISGKDQLLTQFNNQSGVEIRTGQLNMTADARYTDCIRQLPAIGWDHSMNNVQAFLHLPPGWRLLSVFGVDTVSGSWFGQWRLLDLFLALLIGMAIYHLKNISWAVLAWITMILTFHEPSAPHVTWLHLLAVIALLDVVPQGKFHALMRLWFVCAVVLISTYVLPFMMYQIQSGLFPQLEKQTYFKSNRSKPVLMPASDQGFLKSFDQSQRSVINKRSIDPVKTKHHISDAVIQTGPGLPERKWKTVQLQWNGPVDKSQNLRLWLLPPSLNGLLAIIRVFFVSLLLFGIGRRFSQLCLMK